MMSSSRSLVAAAVVGGDDELDEPADQAQQAVDSDGDDGVGLADNEQDVGKDAQADKSLELSTDVDIDVEADIDEVLAALGAVGDAVDLALAQTQTAEQALDLGEQADNELGVDIGLDSSEGEDVGVEERNGLDGGGDIQTGQTSAGGLEVGGDVGGDIDGGMSVGLNLEEDAGSLRRQEQWMWPACHRQIRPARGQDSQRWGRSAGERALTAPPRLAIATRPTDEAA